MAKEAEIKVEEKKIRVAKRVPPGDRWAPLDNETVILDSLTDVLEYVFQIETEEKVIEPEPTKTWSLYGED